MKRLPPTLVRFAPPHGEWRTGELQDGKNGLFITANTIWPPKTALSLVLTLPGERLPVRLSVEVTSARASEPAGMTVMLVDEAPAGEEPARERLARALTRPSSPSRRS